MSFALRYSADSIRSIVSGVMNDSSRFAPDMMMYFEFSKSNEGTVPKVSEYARFTEARQSEGCRTWLGDPKAAPRFWKKTSWKLSVDDQRVPCGPYLSLISVSFLAAKSKASSHDAGRQWPSPRLPTRINGRFRRAESDTCSIPAFPRAQSMPLDFGFSGLGLSLWMTPFSTTAIREHLFTHISHVVGISTRRVSSSGEWLNGLT